ncbi:hypothetical protein [Streptomyces tsukubensis]|nr:hypothetical protein [Streptomyces tsukubensis]QFR95287.1 hypothetical protein GBW32_22500 [Streptomyces tsukubensis]
MTSSDRTAQSRQRTPAHGLSMSALLASCASARAVSTPPSTPETMDFTGTTGTTGASGSTGSSDSTGSANASEEGTGGGVRAAAEPVSDDGPGVTPVPVRREHRREAA